MRGGVEGIATRAIGVRTARQAAGVFTRGENSRYVIQASPEAKHIRKVSAEMSDRHAKRVQTVI